MSGRSKRVLTARLYLAVITPAGLGLGAVIRHTVGAIAALFALVFLIPQVIHESLAVGTFAAVPPLEL